MALQITGNPGYQMIAFILCLQCEHVMAFIRAMCGHYYIIIIKAMVTVLILQLRLIRSLLFAFCTSIIYSSRSWTAGYPTSVHYVAVICLEAKI